ncbi:MAG: hypothetical protein EXX96DRAFT_534326 [Benjaminiella poitrasii]|nr:MAG: hypothetical protein EXX96DRAFT_534326 [Benjaminiella poitrasii]
MKILQLLSYLKSFHFPIGHTSHRQGIAKRFLKPQHTTSLQSPTPDSSYFGCPRCNYRQEIFGTVYYAEKSLVCSRKHAIWTIALGYSYPWLTFTNEQLHNSLLLLQIPATIPQPQRSRFLILISVILFLIWKTYWQFVINGVSFPQDTIFLDIQGPFSLLALPIESS